jgi:ATP-dependent Clp protease adapter protein ClpS
MKEIMINIHIEGADTPVVLPMNKATTFAKELERAGKKWRLGKTC